MRSVMARLSVSCITLVVGIAFRLLPAAATVVIINLCPPAGIQPWSPDFEPDGIIWTTFDRYSIWVYDVARNARYPLPDAAPCGSNCNLSPDARWITYLNAEDRAVGKMRLDGTERQTVATNATEATWWTADTLLVWTAAHEAFLQPEDG